MSINGEFVRLSRISGSATTLKAAAETNRHSYGFEIDRGIYRKAKDIMLSSTQISLPLDQMQGVIK